MKKIINFLQTTLSKEVKTTIGYTIFQIIVIISLLIGTFRLFSDYFDYRVEMEEMQKLNEIKIEVLTDFLEEEKLK